VTWDIKGGVRTEQSFHPGYKSGDPMSCRMVDRVPTQTEDMKVIPSHVVVVVGEPFEIKFDASRICNGMTFENTNGTVAPAVPDRSFVLGLVTWQEGDTGELIEPFGTLQFDGYSTAKKYTIDLWLKTRCGGGSGAYMDCPTGTKVPVDVVNTRAEKTALLKKLKVRDPAIRKNGGK
jgi:hypothetical protein